MTDIQPLPPRSRPPLRPLKKARFVLLLGIVVCLTTLAVWLLTGDAAQRMLLERRSTSDLEQMVSKSPKSPWPYYVLGIRYARAKRIQEAAGLFAKAHEKDPDSYEILLALGKSALFLNDPQEALPILQQAAKVKSDDGTLYTYLAMAQRLTGDKPGGIESAKRATQLSPKSAEAWYQYGIFYTAAENDEIVGRPFLKKAAELAPGDGVYNFQYGSSLTDGSQFDEAIPYLRKATQLLPQNAYAHFLLAVSLHRNGKGDIREILAELKRSIALSPNDYRAHFELGNVLEEQGQFAAALPEFETASRINPNMGEIWFHVSRMADRAGNTDLAQKARVRFQELRRLHLELQALTRRLQEHPEDVAAQIRAGEVLEKQGNLSGAATQFEDVLSRYPQNTQVRTMLDALQRRMAQSMETSGASGGTAP